MQQNNCCDKSVMTDLLTGEKHLAGMYNSFLSECATPEMICCLGELLMDTHNIAEHLFEEMSARGWYPVTKAQENKVNAAKSKFAKGATV